MFRHKLEGRSLWAWMLAALSAPMAQELGSVSWVWCLILGLSVGGLWSFAASRWDGTGLGRIPALAELVFLVLILSRALEVCGDCWSTARHPETLGLVLLVLAACSARKGCRAGARCGAVLFWFLAGMFLLLWVFSVPDAEARWLVPIPGLPGPLAVLVLLLPGAALLLPREGGRPSLPWVLAAALGAAVFPLLTGSVLSPAVAAQTENAFFQMARGIRILGVAERFEAVVAAAMTLGWFCLMSLLLCAGAHMAEQLRPGWGRMAPWLCALCAWGLSLWHPLPLSWAAPAAGAVLWLGIPLAKGTAKRRGYLPFYRNE